jgi:hypothetical protein
MAIQEFRVQQATFFDLAVLSRTLNLIAQSTQTHGADIGTAGLELVASLSEQLDVTNLYGTTDLAECLIGKIQI